MQPSKNTLSDIKNPQTAWLWYGLSALVVGIDQLSKVFSYTKQYRSLSQSLTLP